MVKIDLAPLWVQYATLSAAMFVYTIYEVVTTASRLLLVTGGGLVFLFGVMAWYAFENDEPPHKSEQVKKYITWYIVFLMVLLTVLILT